MLHNYASFATQKLDLLWVPLLSEALYYTDYVSNYADFAVLLVYTVYICVGLIGIGFVCKDVIFLHKRFRKLNVH